MTNLKLSLFVLALFSVYLCVQSLKCYKCDGCNKPSGEQSCNSGEVCATWTRNTTNTTFITNRGCLAKNTCQTWNSANTSISCAFCEKDKCNDATGLTVNIATMAVTLAGVLLVSRF